VNSLSMEVGGLRRDPLSLEALIDAGRAEGVKSFQADELFQAHRTIVELGAAKAAVALFNRKEPVSPKGGPVAEGLSRLRYT